MWFFSCVQCEWLFCNRWLCERVPPICPEYGTTNYSSAQDTIKLYTILKSKFFILCHFCLLFFKWNQTNYFNNAFVHSICLLNRAPIYSLMHPLNRKSHFSLRPIGQFLDSVAWHQKCGQGYNARQDQGQGHFPLFSAILHPHVHNISVTILHK